MIITKEWLQEHNACGVGIRWFLKQEETDSIKVLEALIAEDKRVDAFWLIIRLLSRKQKLQYAIFAAEQVLPIFEEKYPEDNRSRLAIEAAKAVVENDTEENRRGAADAADAAHAVDTSSYSAAYYAAYSAHAAASSAAYFYADDAVGTYSAAAYFYADDAVGTYSATTYSYATSSAHATARKEIQLKNLKYGIDLLKESL